jgi:outer membrane protein OmpA-like peptidoglycan-associated protein
MKGWNPYFYIGGGAMNFDIQATPNLNEGKLTEKNGWVGVFPIGIGSEFALSEKVLFDFAIGGAMSTTYLLDDHNRGSDDHPDSYLNVSAGFTFMGESCSSDKDGDGLGKCDEEKIGTDPRNADTDGDGLTDGEEFLTYKTDPLKVDTDGDGLTDYQEVKTYKTNPLVADTDGDGLSDGDEVLKYKTDPLKVDTDGDGLSDGDEVLKYKTDPLKVDTDGDGLTDGDEVLKYKTDPLKVDTDGDGLTDSEEILKYKTDPLKKDTDGGSVDDFTEVKRGTDPLNPEDDIVKIGVPIVLEGITFATGKADITPESEQILMKAFKTLETYPDITVEISGYTDNVGSSSSNLKLSQKRADSVKGWLVSKGISADRIIAVGHGEDNPRVANDTAENKRLNRRIEFKRIK